MARTRVALIVTLAAVASHAAELPSVDLPRELARVLADYEAAWQQKDAGALAALFTEDGFVLSNGVPPVRGRAAIEKHYTGAGGALSLRAFAYSIGKFTLTLRRSPGGRWLIVSDMDNGNARP